MNHKGRLAVLIVGIAGVALAIAAIASQFMTQEAADRDILRKKLSGDQRFQNVTIEVVQKDNVKTLLVAGVVTSEAELQEMKTIISSSGPKSQVSYWMFVRPQPQK